MPLSPKPQSYRERAATLATLSCAAMLCWPLLAEAQAEPPCGHLANPFGPFEYRSDRYKPAAGDNTSHSFKLQLVEGAHFTVPVQRLTAGNTAAKPGGDLDYTLRAFPNNHRALATVIEAAKRYKDPQDIRLPRPFECYFDRALRFAPDDLIARLLYANFLNNAKRLDEARRQIDYALTLAGDTAVSHFNIGMSYFDSGDYDKALKQAHVAAELGLERPELKRRLQGVGRWVEPPARAASAIQPAAAASAP